MNALQIILLVIASFAFGALVNWFLSGPTKQQIEEAREEIIQEAIDNVTCWHKSENDAEYTMNDEGEEKIRKILEEL